MKTKKKALVIGAMLLIIVLAIILVWMLRGGTLKKPSIYLETKSELVEMSGEEFFVNVKLSSMPEDGFYPASSFSLVFDKTKLEFLGLRDGTMTVSDESGENMEIPVWQCNTAISNENEKINAMYIDMSASNNSYRFQDFETEKKDILVRLQFKLRDSAIAGDEITLSFDDAILASIEESSGVKSLSLVDRTLKAKEFSVKVK